MRPFVRALVGAGVVIVAGVATVTIPGHTSGAAPPPVAGSAVFASDWPTYHHDGLGGGVDPSGTDLSPATVAWTSAPLDGQIYGEPLVEAGRVVVATENDTVYELAPDTGVVIWSTHVGTAVPSGDLPCGNISPTVGITGTPVIDPTRGEVFAVADQLVGSSAQHYLVGVDLYTGAVLLHQAISLPGADQLAQLQRTGLALDGGNVVEGFGGNSGDCGNYHGWVISIPEGGGAQKSFEVASAAHDSQGAVWMGGAAPLVDASGDVWFATGNSAFNSSTDTYDNSDAVVELNSGLVEQQFFTPSTWYSDNGSDLDLGSSSPALLADGLAFQAGKSRKAYVVSQLVARRGGAPAREASSYCGADVDGGSAVVGNVVYTPCQAGVVKTQITLGNPPTITSVWKTSTGSGGPPIVAGGEVWTINPGNGKLFGLHFDGERGPDVLPWLGGESLSHTHGGRRLASGGVDEPGPRIPRARQGCLAQAFKSPPLRYPTRARGAEYGVQLGASGGATPYKWKLAPGSPKPPRGLRLKADGLLTGNPKKQDTPGDYTFTVQATTHRTRGNPRVTATKTLTLHLL